jgi:hypothetical protein
MLLSCPPQIIGLSENPSPPNDPFSANGEFGRFLQVLDSESRSMISIVSVMPLLLVSPNPTSSFVIPEKNGLI